MKKVQCESCGGIEIFEIGEYFVCKSCGSRFIKHPHPVGETMISLDEDVARLLDKCRQDQCDAGRCFESEASPGYL